MSFQTWLQEFYPISAEDFVKNNPNASDKELVDYSLLVWSGLTKENIQKHNLNFYEEFTLYADDIKFEKGYVSCPLCRKYNRDEDGNTCSKDGKYCPLYRFLSHRCYDYKYDDRKFLSKGVLDELLGMNDFDCSVNMMSENTPTPMIDILQKTLEMLENE